MCHFYHYKRVLSIVFVLKAMSLGPRLHGIMPSVAALPRPATTLHTPAAVVYMELYLNNTESQHTLHTSQYCCCLNTTVTVIVTKTTHLFTKLLRQPSITEAAYHKYVLLLVGPLASTWCVYGARALTQLPRMSTTLAANSS